MIINIIIWIRKRSFDEESNSGSGYDDKRKIKTI